jgi:hypothetical protein
MSSTTTVDEDRFIKMKAKLFVTIIVAIFLGTMYFAAVMYKLDSFTAKLVEADKKINYLFKKLRIDNPFTGDINDEDTTHIPRPNRTPAP